MKKLTRNIITLVTVVTMILTIFAAPVTAEAASPKPAKVTVTSATRNASNSKITVKFKSVKKATGYQVAYKKSAAKKYTVKTTKKTSYSFKASNNTAYKVRVRAYRKTKGKTYYGSWSAVKTIKKGTSASAPECKYTYTGKHNWIDIYEDVEVVDQEAWEEQVFTGEYEQKLEEHIYGSAWLDDPYDYHKSVCVKAVDITGMYCEDAIQYIWNLGIEECGQGYVCAKTWNDWIWVTDYNSPIYETIYHDAVTHTERVLVDSYCSGCGKHRGSDAIPFSASK